MAPGCTAIHAGQPTTGTTWLACNLGVVMAHSDRRVLVLDANFRRPRVARRFGLENEPGLGESVVAIIAGMLLSPFFPNNVELFYLQNFYIPYMAGDTGLNLHMGGEFGPMDTRAVIKVNTAVLIPYVAAFFTALYSPMKWDKKPDRFS